ncbi:GNAT family N-acetyltransferase [Rhodopseudomonas sp. B29]|uniref:GNAT family N-acetyltransferase n=1 Tax=Rhodopseudomonas sp. B29 TaxID=95607 RepID=UPI00034C07C4|nr:GNAT family N-acetyltransferase [Rhodopseudomonas sp. B29]
MIVVADPDGAFHRGSGHIMSHIDITVLTPGAPEIGICARWRAEAFPVLGSSTEDERRRLESFVQDQTRQVALLAKLNGVPAGTCLLVPSEIAPNHNVSPWLAGLFVAPEHRRAGVGEALVRAVEDEARLRGFTRLFLYTRDAAAFYQRLGWSVVDTTAWEGAETRLMAIDL